MGFIIQCLFTSLSLYLSLSVPLWSRPRVDVKTETKDDTLLIPLGKRRLTDRSVQAKVSSDWLLGGQMSVSVLSARVCMSRLLVEVL